MKKQYTNIVFKVYAFRNADIVTTSQEVQVNSTSTPTDLWGSAPERDFEDEEDF